MKRISLQEITTEQLVDRFEALALDQDKALLSEQISKVNRLYDQLEEVEAELKARKGDQRSTLLKLYEHPNPQVRVKAAMATLRWRPKPHGECSRPSPSRASVRSPAMPV